MSTQQTTVDFLTEQMKDAGIVTSRKMFGEYAIYCDSKVVALVCDDQLFLKPTEAGKKILQKVHEVPPYPGAKKYFLIDGDYWDDSELLTKLIVATAKELPPPKKK